MYQVETYEVASPEDVSLEAPPGPVVIFEPEQILFVVARANWVNVYLKSGLRAFESTPASIARFFGEDLASYDIAEILVHLEVLHIAAIEECEVRFCNGVTMEIPEKMPPGAPLGTCDCKRTTSDVRYTLPKYEATGGRCLAPGSFRVEPS
jgi:hypothetical protein